MLYPPVPELLKHVEGRYLLVNAIAKRARDISEAAEEEGVSLTEKPVTLAIHDIADGKYSVFVKPEYMR